MSWTAIWLGSLSRSAPATGMSGSSGPAQRVDEAVALAHQHQDIAGCQRAVVDDLAGPSQCLDRRRMSASARRRWRGRPAASSRPAPRPRRRRATARPRHSPARRRGWPRVRPQSRVRPRRAPGSAKTRRRPAAHLRWNGTTGQLTCSKRLRRRARVPETRAALGKGVRARALERIDRLFLVADREHRAAHLSRRACRRRTPRSALDDLHCRGWCPAPRREGCGRCPCRACMNPGAGIARSSARCG